MLYCIRLLEVNSNYPDGEAPELAELDNEEVQQYLCLEPLIALMKT